MHKFNAANLRSFSQITMIMKSIFVLLSLVNASCAIVEEGSLIKLQPINQTIIEGQTTFLHCVMRYPETSVVTWYKDGVTLKEDSDLYQRSLISPDGILTINPTKISDHGEYECSISNNEELQTAKAFLNIQSDGRPVFTINPKPIYIFKLGSTAQMVCDAIDMDGNHRPVISWTMKDGTTLPIERFIQNGGNITLKHIKESDEGIYQCSATNDFGSVTLETEVIVDNVTPRPPYNLTANSTEYAITLQWQPGYSHPSLETTIWYRITNGTDWLMMKISPKNVTEVLIKNLMPETGYDFMVVTEDRFGNGAFSKLFQYSTKDKELD